MLRSNDKDKQVTKQQGIIAENTGVMHSEEELFFGRGQEEEGCV